MEDELDKLYSELCTALKDKLKDKPTASDLNVVRQFLKDNDVTADPSRNKPLNTLVKNLPFDEDVTYQ